MYYLKKRKDGTHVITQAYHELAYKTFWRGKIRQHGKPRRNKQSGITCRPTNKIKKKGKIMKVTYAEGIKAISGSTRQKNGVRMVFTHRKTDKPGEGRMYLRGPKAYERKTPLSEQEIIARILFEKRQAYVQELMREKQLTKKDAWAIAKEVVRGPQAEG